MTLVYVQRAPGGGAISGVYPDIEGHTANNLRPDDDPEVVAFLALKAKRLVSKAAIVDRLIEAGLLAAARKALDAQPLEVQERWNARTAIYADDETALALLKAIGADPVVILAP